MIEVPDEEDDTSFKCWEETEADKCICEKMGYATPRLTSPMVATPEKASAKATEVPAKWLKPFSDEWYWRAVVGARNSSEACAILRGWMLKGRQGEDEDMIIAHLQTSMRVEALEQMHELKQPKQYLCRISSKGRDLVQKVQLKTLEN